MPILFTIFIIFCLWFAYESSRHGKKSQQRYKEFLRREHEAALTRKKDISHIQKIKIPESLPFKKSEDAYTNTLQDDIRKLQSKDIINFTGYTNTDLKLMYGAGHIKYLSECDNNFTKLAVVLNKWATQLYKQNNITDCKKVLEYAVSINVDITHVYILLANIYIDENKPAKINNLIRKASKLNSSISKNIVNQLTELKSAHC